MAMHGFSSHSGSGGGGGSGPVNYLMDGRYYDKEAGIWLPREPLPEVIEGDPALMVQLIDALDHKHKYTSGVLSFSQDDTDKLKVSGLDAAITDITGRLKEMLFAGIAPEHQHILIVAHTHLDRLELHYVTPRHNYEVDRAWNPAPPGEGKFRQMDALTDFINVKYGLDDPRDPLRAKSIKGIEWETADRKSTRETLNAFFQEAVIEGAIDNRKELIELAKKAGFEITRTGKDYVSMKAPGAEKAIRLKGEVYNEQFTSRAKLANTKTKSAERAAYLSKQAVAQRYKQAIRERKCFIEERFKKALCIARTGKDYAETQRFYGAKRGTLVDISKSRLGDFSCKHSNPHNTNNKVKINDSTGREANDVIARAEQLGHDTEQIFNRATRVVEAGIVLVKSATERVREPIAAPPYGVTPIAPFAMASAGASEVSGGFAPADTGDPESDRIINSKRSESIAAAQQEAVRNKQAALRIQESLKIATSLIP